MDLDRVLCRTQTRDGGGTKPPTIPTVQGTDGRAVGPIRTPIHSVMQSRSPGWRWRASAFAVP